MSKRLILIILSLIVVLLSVYMYQEFLDEYRNKNLIKDFEQHQELFEEIVEMFPIGKYQKITGGNYDSNEDTLNYVFNELHYTEIYSDYQGNVFFNKFEKGANFKGLVYVNSPSYVVGILKTKSIYINADDKWIIYYSHGL